LAQGLAAAAVLLPLLLTGCATPESASRADADAVESPAAENGVTTTKEPLFVTASELADSATQSQRLTEPVFYRGNDRQIRLPAAREPLKLVGDDVSLNFEQAPLSEVTHAILGDILQLDYVVDQPIQGQVTLRTRTPVPRDQLLGILESLLKANNVIMIRGEDGRFLITGSEQATRLSPGVTGPASGGAGYSTMVVPLRYISAANMAEILRPVAEESAFVRIDNARNLLMLAGTRAQLNGWLEMVQTFDVDMLQGMSVGLFPLENTSVRDVGEALQAMLGGAAGGTVSDIAHLVRIIPIERLNSILVVTPRGHYLDRIRSWVERLDRSPDTLFEKRLYVYQVQNTIASRLAQLLTSIYSGGGRGRGGGVSSWDTRPADTAAVAPGLSLESIGGSSKSGMGGDGGATPIHEAARQGASGAEGPTTMVTSVGGGEGSVLEDVRVVADDENNALMIYATGKQYKIITAALEQLDVVATQVIIEASILEVTLTDDLEYGLEWTFKNSVGDDYSGTGLLANTGTLPTGIPGFSYTVTNSVGDISAVLSALATESLLNVISTPSVMVLDNHTAYIHVGEQVPVFDQQTETEGGRITQSVTYRDTGVKLLVTPSVNAGGLVTMSIEQSVTDIGPVEDTTNQRRFLERSIVSRVAVRSDESVVLGGLIREKAEATSTGVPFLHSIPVVGSLFGTDIEGDERTELLVIITPRALYNESELREVSEEMRKQIRHMELLEKPPI
jgi:general secretion pathway protein D